MAIARDTTIVIIIATTMNTHGVTAVSATNTAADAQVKAPLSSNDWICDSLKPAERKTMRVSLPAAEAAAGIFGWVRLKRGAGAGWVTPAMSMKAPRA